MNDNSLQSLIDDVLAARFSAPYPEDITDQVCIAIEGNPEWRQRYEEMVESYRREGDVDSAWRVNNNIPHHIMNYTGLKTIKGGVPSTSKLMKSFSLLGPPGAADDGNRQTDLDSFAAAVATLRPGLAVLEEDEALRDICDARDDVLGRFGPLFAPDHLATLSADAFASFLDFKINRHWSGIHRQKSKMTAGDMHLLRAALAVLLDESRPLAERYDETMSRMKGMGKATATPILLVAYPDRYGVWNSKSEAGLRRLKIFPTPSYASEGAQYAAINDVLLRLAAALEVDLWTLDTLWEWFLQQPTLAFIRTTPNNRQDMIPIQSAEDLATWVEDGSFDVLLPVAFEEAVRLGAPDWPTPSSTPSAASSPSICGP